MSGNLKRYKIGIAYRPGRPHIAEKWGKLTPLEKWMKNYKAKTCKKAVFYVFVIF